VIKEQISLRKVRPDDSDLVLQWRNHPETRKHSFQRDLVSAEEHRRWFSKKLKDPKTAIYIVQDAQGRPVGQVRIDRAPDHWGEVSISISHRAKGKGIGTEALKKTVSRCRQHSDLKGLVAHIMPDNTPSMLAFLKAGFVLKKIEQVRKNPCCRLESLCRKDPTTGARRPQLIKKEGVGYV